MLCGEYTLAIHDDVFGDLPLLMETQQNVQGILTKAWDAFPSVRVGAALQEVAEAAHDAYVPYISMYPTCLGKLQEIRKIEAVSAILHDAETKEGASIDSLLITPIQRMPRYRLLLKSLLKQTAADHVDHSALQQALHAVENTASRLNRAVNPIVSLLHRRTGSRRYVSDIPTFSSDVGNICRHSTRKATPTFKLQSLAHPCICHRRLRRVKEDIKRARQQSLLSPRPNTIAYISAPTTPRASLGGSSASSPPSGETTAAHHQSTPEEDDMLTFLPPARQADAVRRDVLSTL